MTRPTNLLWGMPLEPRSLQHMDHSAAQHAALWGASAQGVRETAQEWQENWADARALLSISLVMGVNVLVMSSVESAIEYITHDGKMGEERPTWVLHYRKDHYEALQPPPPEQLELILRNLNLEPWIHAKGHGRGGATCNAPDSPGLSSLLEIRVFVYGCMLRCVVPPCP